jgi:predicted  nucleic acid-binding Zn-ribbon protein
VQSGFVKRIDEATESKNLVKELYASVGKLSEPFDKWTSDVETINQKIAEFKAALDELKSETQKKKNESDDRVELLQS